MQRDFLHKLLEVRVPVMPLELGAGVDGAVARLDLLHPVVSGNKLFKLFYYLEACGGRRVQTFGGAWSNHLLATAYACQELGIPCTGVVRGEAPKALSPTLKECRAYGMALHFVSREEFRELSGGGPGRHTVLSTGGSGVDAAPSGGGLEEGDTLVIPEGGAGEPGIRGAGLLLGSVPAASAFSHILCATGTGTTLEGVERSLGPGQSALGVAVLKVPPEDQAAFSRSRVVFSYAFGGYARHTPALLAFMRDFHAETGIPTDFVYTAKAAFALRDLARQGYFPRGSRVLFLHTGGLQGNRSLAAFNQALFLQ